MGSSLKPDSLLVFNDDNVLHSKALDAPTDNDTVTLMSCAYFI